MVYPGAAHSSQIKAEETWIIESFCTETNPSPFFLLTYTLAQIRMLKENKGKEAKTWGKSRRSAVLTFSFDHTVLDIMLPVTKLSHIKDPPRETSETTSGGKPQETKLFRDHLSFFYTSPFLLSFFHPLLSLLSIKTSSTALPGSSIYHRFCLLGSAITDRLPKEHHSPPAISAYPLRGRARGNSAQSRLKTAEWQRRPSAYNPHWANMNLSFSHKMPERFLPFLLT